MTNPDYRAMCAELVDALAEWRIGGGPPEDTADADLIARARALLAQPVAEVPTDKELWAAGSDDFRANCYPTDAIAYARTVLARWGHPTPQPVWADIHYAWELHDAAGDWQAGGSANSLEDVQREGNRYLQTYAKDGPHKLIIQRHCVNTIEEVTHD